MRAARAALALLLVLCVASPAGAQEAGEPSAEPEHRLNWTYQKFRLWQFIAIGVQTAANLYFEIGDVPSNGESWRSPLPLDKPVRNALVAESDEGKQRARTIADGLWYGTEYYTVVIDGLLVPLAFDRGNTLVASQLTLINWQALGLAGIITRIAHHSVPRARPMTYGCSDEPGAAFPCRSQGPGFFSGHAAMAMTGATLACSHHAALPLYGEGPQGMITCGVLVSGSITVGIMRIMADKHWLTDVLVGYTVGASVGLGLPWLLHYQHHVTPDLSGIGIPRVAWVPAATPEGGSLSLVGWF
jgi:membrane-associated phospholipid phosphatase